MRPQTIKSKYVLTAQYDALATAYYKNITDHTNTQKKFRRELRIRHIWIAALAILSTIQTVAIFIHW